MDDPYENPTKAEITIDAGKTNVHTAVEIIIGHLRAEGYIA